MENPGEESKLSTIHSVATKCTSSDNVLVPSVQRLEAFCRHPARVLPADPISAKKDHVPVI